MATKGSMPTYASVKDYVLNQPEVCRNHLNRFVQLIAETLPHASEMRPYKVPAYTLYAENKTKLQVMFSAGKDFLSFYPFETTIRAFHSELSMFKTGKGSVQFPYNQPLPEDLIRRMLLHRYTELREN